VFGTRSRSVSAHLATRVRKIAETTRPVPAAPAAAAKRELRAPSFKPGTLTFVGGEKLSVMVTNISDRGARVEYVRGTRIPDCVQLTEPMSGTKKWAYVSWQTWGMAGLEFVGRDPSGKPFYPPQHEDEA
jgi:hypothetical protein